MKNIKLKIISILIMITILIPLLVVVGYTVNAEDTETVIFSVVGTPIEKTIVQKLEIKPSTYEKIGSFPINKAIFDSDSDFFCAQHGIPYGSSAYPTKLAAKFHTSHVITKHKVTTSSNPMGDIDDTALIYIDYDEYGRVKIYDDNLSGRVLESFKESTETGEGIVYTNWIYSLKEVEMGCKEGTTTCEEVDTLGSHSEITGRGIAFLLACYKQTDAERASTGYNKDPLQIAVWDYLGQLQESDGKNALKDAAIAYQDYHDNSDKPNVDVNPRENVGTTKSGTTYTVGPFQMSDYVRAEDFKYDEKGVFTGGDPDNEIVYDTTETEETEDTATDNYYDVTMDNTNMDLQSTFDKYGEGYDGTIIKAKAILTNENGDIGEIVFDVPKPNKEFYLTFQESEIEKYDEVLDIVFTYQRIHAHANGTLYSGAQKAIKFIESNGTATTNSGCENEYFCTNRDSGHTQHSHDECHCDGWELNCSSLHHSDSCYTKTLDCSNSEEGHEHDEDDCYSEDLTCDYPLGHDHSIGKGCYDPICKGTHTDCHGHELGEPVITNTDAGQYETSATEAFCSDHDHNHCQKFTWNNEYTIECDDSAQDGLAAAGDLFIEQIEYKIRVSVPMKTKMAIYKYITKVEHVGEEVVTYDNETERREMSMSEKEADAVKVEKGDKVTYKVEIINDSRFPTTVKVKDTLPELCSDEEMDTCFLGAESITVQPHSKNEYIITLRTNADSGKYTNVVEFTTTNDTNPTMKYSEWDNGATHGPRTNGSIVNMYTKEKDSDTYQIKEYYVSIQKYIYDVEHNQANIGVSGELDTTMSASDERRRGGMTEEEKQSNPVYAEYGDTVTYKIVVYNTTENKDSEFDVNRQEEPYWAPYKVYVNIKDTLPQKYSNLSFEVSPIMIRGYNAHTSETSADISTEGGTLVINDLMIPTGSTRTITVTLTVDEYTKGTIETNTAEMIDGVRNINRGPLKGFSEDDKYCLIKNNSTNTISKDYYKLNNYDLTLDKYLYKYDESMLILNNDNGYTSEDSIIGEDNILIQDRKNTVTGTEGVSDGNVTDIINIYNPDHESYKLNSPVNVEKTEKLTYVIKAINEADTINKVTDKPSTTKRATQVRTTEVVDYMQQGLQLDSVTAKIYDANGNVVTRYAEDGSVTVSSTADGTLTIGDKVLNKYKFTIGNETILKPGEYIEYYVEVTVIESNMYLYSLENRAELSILTNINNTDETSRIIKDNTHNENIAKQQSSSEYVRMKDLVISGKVWIDVNKDGLMNDKAKYNDYATMYDGDEEKLEEYKTKNSLFKKDNNVNNNAMKKDVVVNLYRVDKENVATKIRSTKTDANGLYTFGRDEALAWKRTYINTETYQTGEIYQRIDKASSKDTNGNYQDGLSEYYKYYIEFEYDGVLYRSTELYAGMDNLTKNDGRFNSKYPKDSNATEFNSEREEFNEKYEYISYNSAYSVDNDLQKTNTLDFQKDGHASYLMEDTSRKMTAKSFITKHNTTDVLAACKLAMNSCGSSKWKQCSNHWDDWQIVISMGLIDEAQYPNTTAGRKAAQNYLKSIYSTLENNASDTGDTQMIKYLWLYSFNGDVDYTIPETEYLKYINLGLELREDVDLELTKDVYQVKTTINGEEMSYNYNLGYTEEYLNDYISKKPYGFEIYESDYKYRFDQYLSKEVQKYKGTNGEDELNIEVTYRINLNNKSTRDEQDLYDYYVNAKLDTSSSKYAKNQETLDERIATYDKNTKLVDAKVNEVLDLYDENFIKVQFGANGLANNQITIKQKDENGDLIDARINVGEAWMFMKESEVPEGLEKSTEKYSIIDTDAEKPIYKEDSSGEYVKVMLQLAEESVRRDKSIYTTDYKFSEKTNDFTSDGYNSLYIRGMDKITIPEGEDLDIYVKYVVDKATLEITVDDSIEETVTTSTTVNDINQSLNTAGIGSLVITGIAEKTEETTEYIGELKRSIKLAERTLNKINGRGTENIAQINAYSMWYPDGKPASLVDKDSNAGNLGVQNLTTGKTPKTGGYSDDENASADDINFYEDTTYKTGIELAGERTENPPDEVNNNRYSIKIFTEKEIESEPRIIREISGKVWDDTRSEVLTETSDEATAKDKQYIGNGLYNVDANGIPTDVIYKDKENPEAKSNESLELNYTLDPYVDVDGDGNKDPISEEYDLLVRNVKVEFIEIVPVPVDASGEVRTTRGVDIAEQHYYEQTLRGVSWEQVQNIRTDENGQYVLSGMKPGIYIVRFTYGDTVTGDSVAKEDMLVFNGQDYKSTTYNPNLLDTETSMDEILRRLEEPSLSDARDDEIRRLEVNEYSEVMTNDIAEVLKGLASDDDLTPNTTGIISGNLEKLTDNTYMEAETREFLIKAEKLTPTQIAIYDSYEEVLESKDENNNIFTTVIHNFAKEFYNKLSYYMTKDKDGGDLTRKFEIQNIDFGLVYRPENEISLIKEIGEIKLITEDGNTLVDLYFDTVSDGANRKHVINSEKSIGVDLIQFITNDYSDKALINNLMSEELKQGLIYIQVDQELLQGCTVAITYSFNAQNNSEVDRITQNLDKIRYKANPETNALIAEYGYGIINTDKYTASGTAAKVVELENYRNDGQLNYRICEKLMTTNGQDGYYGRFVGYSYYTGELEKHPELDTIATLKFDKILDYVDTGLEFEPDKTQKDMTNRLWYEVTKDDLTSHLYTFKSDINKKLTNISGVEYDTLVVSSDDRIMDDKYSSDRGEFASVDNSSVKNNDLSRFLLPKVLVTGYLPKSDDVDVNTAKYNEYIALVDSLSEEDLKKFSGTISLEVSKVLSANTKDDDMTYENMAEIIQFTTLTGRRTNFATTIGNADIHEIQRKIDEKEPPFNPPNGNNAGSIEFTTASLEPDTSATETVTLIPPTGLMKSRRPIVSFMQGAKTGVEVISMTGLVIASIAAGVVIVLFVIRKYKKRRIK